jgi:GTPase SAR1 family protein
MQIEESTRICDIKYKIIFLGESYVGKSSLIYRFTKDEFYDSNVFTL